LFSDTPWGGRILDKRKRKDNRKKIVSKEKKDKKSGAGNPWIAEYSGILIRAALLVRSFQEEA
jgi:hypothetical protein